MALISSVFVRPKLLQNSFDTKYQDYFIMRFELTHTGFKSFMNFHVLIEEEEIQVSEQRDRYEYNECDIFFRASINTSEDIDNSKPLLTALSKVPEIKDVFFIVNSYDISDMTLVARCISVESKLLIKLTY